MDLSAGIKFNDGTFMLRNFRASDIDSIVANANNKNVSRNLRDTFPFPYLRKDALDWINICENAETYSRQAIVEVAVDQAVGGIGFIRGSDVHRFSAEIGYWIGESYWGRRIMSNAVIQYTEHLFRVTDLNRLWAGVYETNPTSAKVLEKAGFLQEGIMKGSVFKDGVFLDQLLYAKLKG